MGAACRGGACGRVAILNDALVGYTSAAAEVSTWLARDHLHMDCLFVSPTCRGRGIGTALISALATYARTNRYSEIQWQTPDWNLDAARYYRNLGALAQSKIRFRMQT